MLHKKIRAMFTIINKKSQIPENATTIFLFKKTDKALESLFSEEETAYINQGFEKDKQRSFSFNRLTFQHYVELVEEKETPYYFLESLRQIADRLVGDLQSQKTQKVYVSAAGFSQEEIIAFVEGMVLANYSFTAYKTDKEKVVRSLETVSVVHEKLTQASVDEINIVMEATLMARSLVNRPVNYLNAVDLAEEIKSMALDAGARVEIFNKKKIEALKMGGLLAVNKGSVDPPTFTVFEYKPANATNKKPLVFLLYPLLKTATL